MLKAHKVYEKDKKEVTVKRIINKIVSKKFAINFVNLAKELCALCG
jgi:hypothetical protein